MALLDPSRDFVRDLAETADEVVSHEGERAGHALAEFGRVGFDVVEGAVGGVVHPVEAGVETEEHFAEGGGLDEVAAGAGEETGDWFEFGEGVEGGGDGGEEGGEVGLVREEGGGAGLEGGGLGVHGCEGGLEGVEDGEGGVGGGEEGAAGGEVGLEGRVEELVLLAAGGLEGGREGVVPGGEVELVFDLAGTGDGGGGALGLAVCGPVSCELEGFEVVPRFWPRGGLSCPRL